MEKQHKWKLLCMGITVLKAGRCYIHYTAGTTVVINISLRCDLYSGFVSAVAVNMVHFL